MAVSENHFDFTNLIMHIHILGICGTFMGGVARLAVEKGFKVTGSDSGVYPPMSDQLKSLGIDIFEGWSVRQFDKQPDLIVIGNALSRGNEAVEFVLNQNFPYVSGPDFINSFILKDKWVLAVAGTHGKTTTTSILAWILEYANMKPGFLIGGVAENFGISSRLGDSDFFVIEADEYDTAFFDKRSKFVHYHPKTLIINNLEFDHADIFDSLKAIQTQFNHLLRTIPSSGKVIFSNDYPAISETFEMGVWSETESVSTTDLSSNWKINPISNSYDKFEVFFNQELLVSIDWNLIGEHNASNALVAIAAARHVGITPEISADALREFKSVKRRLEKLGNFNGVNVYDDFAHHPTAIKLTLSALRAAVGKERILVVMEPRSNTMKKGSHKDELENALQDADEVFMFDPGNLEWSLSRVLSNYSQPLHLETDIDSIVSMVSSTAKSGDHILIMSNGSFQGVYSKLCDKLSANESD